MKPSVDVLIPTYHRAAALAVTLTSMVYQTYPHLRIVISDQSEGDTTMQSYEVQAAIRVLSAHSHTVEFLKHPVRLGMAEQRQFLLDHSYAIYCLYSDDDLIYEPYVIDMMVETIEREHCGFVGSSVTGLSYVNDYRPSEEKVEFWEGPVLPEDIRPGSGAWDRAKLHNAANTYHLQQALHIDPRNPRVYRVAWVGGCVLYQTEKLRKAGGFGFWKDLPSEHSGEDVLAQNNVMRLYGGCGVLPSGVYHQELPTTVVNRTIDAPFYMDGLTKT